MSWPCVNPGGCNSDEVCTKNRRCKFNQRDQPPVFPDPSRCQFCGELSHPGECRRREPTATTGAMREKLNTLPYDLVPFQEITDAFVRVAEVGAVKYEPWNWSKGLARVQLIGSLLRHVFAYLRGQDRDTETGLLHTDHILWNAVALSHNVHHNLEDGRRPEPKRDYQP